MALRTFAIGSKVVVNIAKENRDWGYNPWPDGTEVTVTGYDEIVYARNLHFGDGPGVFENTSWCRVTDGQKTESISVCFLKGERVHYSGKKLRDLPESNFWEGDHVHADGHGDGVIERITYKSENIPHSQVYTVARLHGGTIYNVRECELTLRKRGHIWNEGHGVEPEFADMKDHVAHEQQVSRFDEVRNPLTNLYAWTLPEVMQAILDGLVDGFKVSGFFGHNSISAFKLHNEKLGAELRAHMLKEFTGEAVSRLPAKSENSPFVVNP